MPNLKQRMELTHPPLYFQDIALLLAERGWTIDRISPSQPHDGHTTGFAVTDNNGIRHRWESLQDLKLSIL